MISSEPIKAIWYIDSLQIRLYIIVYRIIAYCNFNV